jgi:hypothetical protein
VIMPRSPTMTICRRSNFSRTPRHRLDEGGRVAGVAGKTAGGGAEREALPGFRCTCFTACSAVCIAPDQRWSGESGRSRGLVRGRLGLVFALAGVSSVCSAGPASALRTFVFQDVALARHPPGSAVVTPVTQSQRRRRVNLGCRFTVTITTGRSGPTE